MALDLAFGKLPSMHSCFDHEKLDVYRASLSFVMKANEVIKNMPKGHAYLHDQLRRAGSSITLNIAEGAGEYSRSEKLRFYRMARRSATECAGILDICRNLQLVDSMVYLQARELLLRIVAMLTNLVR